MSAKARRILIPLIVAAAAIGIVALVMMNPRGPTRPRETTAPETGETAPEQQTQRETGDEGEDVADQAEAPPAQAPSGDQSSEEDQPDETPRDQPALALTGLHAVAPDGGFSESSPPAPIGSVDWRRAQFLIQFSPHGAGIDSIIFSDIWNTAQAKRKAEKIKKRIERGEATLADLPAKERYVLQKTREFVLDRTGRNTAVLPSFVARKIVIPGINDPDDRDDDEVNLFGTVWSQRVSGDRLSCDFYTEIRNDQDEPVIRITRTYRLGADSFDITVEQRIENLTSHDLDIRWLQYGPADLDEDPTAYMDRRRYRMGYLVDPQRLPHIVQADKSFYRERGSVIKIGTRNAEPDRAKTALWPNERSTEEGYELSWFAAENRYFAMAMHPVEPRTTGDYSLADVVATITPYYDGKKRDNRENPGNNVVAFELWSPTRKLPAGETLALDFATYAGPLDREILNNRQPYVALNMDELILYQLSPYCGWCTFQWLAHLLLWFLSLVYAALFDWGIAIIALVVIVRLLLHPITKRSQISIQRFGKVMQKIKPEIDKLQAKYKNDPKRIQQEQMRLMREYGVSPMSMLGCLPMFLQMPIWIALYAMLYFAFDLRHQPAFWGVFQVFGGWPFLGDLSAPDQFIPFPWDGTIFYINYGAFNILPILMGLVFFVQQKYMTPANPNMSEEQKRMQKMMKITFLLFPLFLYSAPSGLTLYIMTSSIWGIIESRHIRKHIDSIDLDEEIKQRQIQKAKQPKLPRNPQQRALAQMMQNQRERAKRKRQPPPKRFKKRK